MPIPGLGRSPGWEDPLEKEIATHSRILAWKMSWTERSLVGCSPWGRKESGRTEQLNSGGLHTLITGRSDVSFYRPLEKGMATHSSIFAWRIPWTEEPGGLQSMGLQRVRHERATGYKGHKK